MTGTAVPPPVTVLPPGDEAWRQKVASFACEQIAPRVRDMDAQARLDPALVRDLFGAGLMGVEVPEAYGGCGGDLFRVVLAIEEIARVDPAVAVLVDVQNALVISALLRHGDGDARRRHLPRLATGTVGAYALSEAQAGSDAFALATTARPDGNGYLLTGTKRWTSSAREAGLFLVFARLVGTGQGGDRQADAGLTAFLVERDTPGVRVGEPVPTMGIRASSACDVSFDEARVSGRDVLGRPGGGELLAVETLNTGKLGIAAQLVGLAGGALGIATGYAGTRKQFGQPIAGFQGVSFPLARLAAELAGARALLYDTARLLQGGGSPAQRLRATAMAKYLASEIAERAAAQAVETLGGNGLAPWYGAEKLYRDAKVGKIYEGTSNMQFRTIAGTFARPAAPGGI
jgi:alkylation response protein AidB-like acyl-CoA dehydrogenase